MEQIDLFCEDLKGLGITPILTNGTLCMEYSIDQVDHEAVKELLNKYIGYLKSMGIETNHSREERITRYTYKIPVTWVTGEDISED